jgi:hypothetical protein
VWRTRDAPEHKCMQSRLPHFLSRVAVPTCAKRSAGSALAPPGSGGQATGGVRVLVAPATCPTGLASVCGFASLGPPMTPSRITGSEPGVGANCSRMVTGGAFLRQDPSAYKRMQTRPRHFRSRTGPPTCAKRSAGSALALPGSGGQANGGVRLRVAPATCPTGLASECGCASLGPPMTPSRITGSGPGVGANC